MLRLEVIINDDKWPQLIITVNRESLSQGQVTAQEKIQYDLAYDKAEVMVHNQLRPLIMEIISRRKRGAQPREAVQT